LDITKRLVGWSLTVLSTQTLEKQFKRYYNAVIIWDYQLTLAVQQILNITEKMKTF